MSLLAAYLGGEEKAEQWRRDRDRRQRDQLIHSILRGERELRDQDQSRSPTTAETEQLRAEVSRLQETVGSLRREIQGLQTEIPAIADERARVVMADELPEALAYLTARKEPTNGQTNACR
jgi:hypothetical protein